jgi:Tol biopolymer transport system component
LAMAGPLTAQYVPFGKNKVQYTPFKWHVLSGPHVDVYYYPEEEDLAQVALSYAEESFDSLTALFRDRPFRRIPMIIYSSHQHFEQTNVTAAFLPEGVAGFTEFLKRRIALPFNGSYNDFRHTIRHELVHFFQLAKLTRVFEEHPRFRPPFVPLWWSEGLAERWSSEQDSEDEMYVRDLVLSGDLPSLMQLTYMFSFIAYPLGGELHRYLGERFGYGRVADFYDSLWKYGSFEEAFAGTYGITLEQLNAEWRYELERKYYPEYEDRKPLAVEARPVVKQPLNFKPTLYGRPDGSIELFFMSPRTGYTSIYSVYMRGGDQHVRPVVRGDKSEEFESLHFFWSALDVSSTGKLVFVSKFLENDAIQIYDLQKRKIVGRYQFPDLVSMSSPSWSPDGKKIVFSGLSKAGPSDLYILDFTTQEHYAITDDRYLENDPDWSPDGRYIVFSSDRTTSGSEGDENLFLYDLENGAVRYLTYGPWQDLDPAWSPDGRWVVFSSDRTGFYDLFLVDRDGRGGRLTSYTAGLFDPEWMPDGSGLVFGAYEDGTFNIFFKALKLEEDQAEVLVADQLVDRFEPPEPKLAVRLADRFGPPPEDLDVEQGWTWVEMDRPLVAEASVRPYKTKYALDFAAGQAVFAPGFGSAQGIQFLASDMLGNHLLYFAVVAQNFGGSVGNIFDSFAGQAMYLNLSRRVNWGVGAFRWNGRFVDAAFSNIYVEKTFGGFFVASYPFSKFRRLEVQTTLEYSDRLDIPDLLEIGTINLFDDTLSLTRKGVIATNSVSYVKDNTLWLPTGPIDGVRWNVTVAVATDLTSSRVENYTLVGDFRRYFRTSLLSALAIRLFGFYSDGAIPSRIAIGGAYTLRLYPFLGFIGSRVWLFNAEWRFPILHGLALGFPFGTMQFPGVQAAPFFDLAQVWLEDRSPLGLWGSYGIGFRMPILFPLVLRLDVGRRFKSGGLPTGLIRGFDETEVAFFIGFNY